MNWNLVRGLTYAAALAASALALAGLADFNPTTGHLEIHPFNLYAAVASAAGLVSSAIAGLALIKGWGRK